MSKTHLHGLNSADNNALWLDFYVNEGVEQVICGDSISMEQREISFVPFIDLAKMINKFFTLANTETLTSTYELSGAEVKLSRTRGGDTLLSVLIGESRVYFRIDAPALFEKALNHKNEIYKNKGINRELYRAQRKGAGEIQLFPESSIVGGGLVTFKRFEGDNNNYVFTHHKANLPTSQRYFCDTERHDKIQYESFAKALVTLLSDSDRNQINLQEDNNSNNFFRLVKSNTGIMLQVYADNRLNNLIGNFAISNPSEMIEFLRDDKDVQIDYEFAAKLGYDNQYVKYCYNLTHNLSWIKILNGYEVYDSHVFGFNPTDCAAPTRDWLIKQLDDIIKADVAGQEFSLSSSEDYKITFTGGLGYTLEVDCRNGQKFKILLTHAAFTSWKNSLIMMGGNIEREELRRSEPKVTHTVDYSDIDPFADEDVYNEDRPAQHPTFIKYLNTDQYSILFDRNVFVYIGDGVKCLVDFKENLILLKEQPDHSFINFRDVIATKLWDNILFNIETTDLSHTDVSVVKILGEYNIDDTIAYLNGMIDDLTDPDEPRKLTDEEAEDLAIEIVKEEHNQKDFIESTIDEVLGTAPMKNQLKELEKLEELREEEIDFVSFKSEQGFYDLTINKVQMFANGNESYNTIYMTSDKLDDVDKKIFKLLGMALTRLAFLTSEIDSVDVKIGSLELSNKNLPVGKVLSIIYRCAGSQALTRFYLTPYQFEQLQNKVAQMSK